ncbi:28S ribosomal protein S18a, mitochondrial [Pararge aegeria]|uniref:Large ribosomal subunit protein mL66 n=1 Tax=Pararge aegeria aegeria TaxID=348720 RepID=A0A8S4R374_9NEOP|nr:28S ribosomal protein S18a, mitochondrial [Pararge aegeria]CAH2229249.1 jg13625 [Pararge aegeria aegeria]
MSFLTRASCLAKNAILSTFVRSISTTNQLRLKQIHEYKEGSTLIVEATSVPSPNTELLVRAEKIKDLTPAEKPEHTCYMCALDLDVKHTDVLILSQFVRSDGCMLPRRITGLCRRQQKKIGKMVSMAQKAGLMINLTPSYCKKDPKQRYAYKKFNTYFDEKTIFMRNIPKPVDRFKR